MNKSIRKCRICGSEMHESIRTKDLNYGGEEFFTYLRCPVCLCLQIAEIPQDMSQYYGKQYYSQNMLSHKGRGIAEKAISFFLQIRDKRLLANDPGIVRKLCCRMQPRPAYEQIVEICGKQDAVLDVGCGDGYLLKLMKEMGYTNLTGVDLYLNNPKDENGLQLIKGDISKVGIERKFDLIMFHHSLEHMPDQLDVFRNIRNLLRNDNSHCMICIPLSDSFAFQKYRDKWVQLDAPRHFYLHSKKSITMLANEADLQVTDIIYDSNSFQFYGSELYQKGEQGASRRKLKKVILYAIISIFKYARLADELNKKQMGDQAIFILRKK